MKVDGPGPVPKEMLRYFRGKSNVAGFDYRDIWRAEHAHAFTVAKAMQADVLQEIRDALDRSMANGLTFRQFEKALTPQLQALGWWGKAAMKDPVTGKTILAQLGSPRRLKTIFSANMSTARTAGQWARAQRTKAALPYFLYELGPSHHHRPAHVAWHGVMLPIDDPWWDTHIPRNGWGCKCRVRQVSRTEANRLQKTGVQAPVGTPITNPETGLPTGHAEKARVPVQTKAPAIHRVPWQNKRTGQVERVPAGIDPGWDTNPGKVRQQNLEEMLAGKINGLSDTVQAAAVKDLAASGRFERWVDRVTERGAAAGEIQIAGAIDRETRNFLLGKGVNITTPVIDIDDKAILHSARTAKAARKAALSTDDLRSLPEKLLTADRYWDAQDPALIYAFDVAAGPGRPVGKAVVRVNYRRKGLITNRVVTTGVVRPENLGDPRYEAILNGK